MAATIPASGISLRGAAEADGCLPGSSSAILLKLGDRVLDDLKKASSVKDGLRFLTGNTPKLRIGSRTIDLTISADDFRNELFASSAGISSTDFTFASVVSHRAELKAIERASAGDRSGSDAALAALKNSLASYEQEKQSKQVNITNSVLPAPKSRFDAAKKEKQANRSKATGRVTGSQTASPSLSAVGTPRLGGAPTSALASEDEVKMQAMKKPVVHLLAMKSISSEEIARSTHIPKSDLETILQRVGKQGDGKWQLTDRAYKELDVWKFEYPSQADRQSAIDNAVKAYDRLRLGKEDKLWQLLLPRDERGKGKVLSRLHLGGPQVNRGLTPHYQPSPAPQAEAVDSRVTSAANTPRLGPASSSTPRPGSSKGDVMKRLLSKDPKRARAAEDAKGQKRKEREAAASDREAERPAKKQATKKTVDPKVKSAEFVESSDDDSEEVVRKAPPKVKPETAKAASKPKKAVANATSSESSDTPVKQKTVGKQSTKAKPSATANKSTASPAVKANNPTTNGKSTPKTQVGLSAPASNHKAQRSPQKSDSRPSVPSPLGAARPRLASDVSDRASVGVQKANQGGADTPKGLGISDSVRKRQDAVTSNGSAAASEADMKTRNQTAIEKQQKPATNGTSTPKPALTNGANDKRSNGVKRKAEDTAPKQSEADSPANHRKTNSDSSQSQNSLAISNNAPNSTPRTSPDGHPDGSSSDSAASVLDTITYNQGVALAEVFRDKYYPAYAKLYDEQAAIEARGEKVSKEERERLLAMHSRLGQMKREIFAASKRENLDD
ncbi:hypothetical protein LTR37_010160 [Vermiconidia calcicola]|uniref:Uncharacterized protein n=1 Tax=Vermiconidia calcicola TaxID=1690605 RepID=A0ACC3N697_9PEZI|nr:hypothetical protein LTR37_010160 [Vermiconidia calcicola]